ncbi:MAG: LCP family protein [Candidatus Limivicinus sp.]
MSHKDDYRPSHLASNENSEPNLEAGKTKNNHDKLGHRRIHPAIWITALVLTVLIGAGYLCFSHFYSRLNFQLSKEDMISTLKESISSGEVEAGEELPIDEGWDYKSADVMNLLLIGVDNDYYDGMNDRGNADGLMILSVNKSTKQIVLSSLMRDVKVSVPGAGYKTKLTLVYHYEGLETLIDTIEQNFGVPIDNYVMVNYLSVVDMVDAMGGIELEVTSDELYWMEPKIKNLNLLLGQDGEANLLDPAQAGTLTLNGIQTAAYLRIRYAGNGDFDRTERARTVLMALADKARGMKMKEMLGLADRVLPQITTDLSQTRTLSLLMSLPKYLGYDMVSNRIPIDDSWYFENNSNGSFVIIDYPVNREFLYRSIYEGTSE